MNPNKTNTGILASNDKHVFVAVQKSSSLGKMVAELRSTKKMQFWV